MMRIPCCRPAISSRTIRTAKTPPGGRRQRSPWPRWSPARNRSKAASLIVTTPTCFRLLGRGDHHPWARSGKIQPVGLLTFPCGSNTRPSPRFVCRTTGNPEPLLGAVRTRAAVDKNLAFTNGQNVRQILGQGVGRAVWARRLLVLFVAARAHPPKRASIGIDGVLAYSVAQRKRS